MVMELAVFLQQHMGHRAGLGKISCLIGDNKRRISVLIRLIQMEILVFFANFQFIQMPMKSHGPHRNQPP